MRGEWIEWCGLTIMLLGASGWIPAGAQPVPAHWLSYQSHDLFYLIDYRSDWEFVEQDESNEVKFQSGNVSVSVAAANDDEGYTVEQFLEVNKSLLRQQCPAAEVQEEGKATVAGVPGAYFTMFCPGPRLPTVVRISVALNFGKFFILNVTAPSAELPAFQAAIDRMARSFKAGDGLPEGREPRKRAR
jgi:hypothetical protein